MIKKILMNIFKMNILNACFRNSYFIISIFVIFLIFLWQNFFNNHNTKKLPFNFLSKKKLLDEYSFLKTKENDNYQYYKMLKLIIISNIDSINNIFKQRNIDKDDIISLIKTDKDLLFLKKGQIIYWSLNKKKKIKTLVWKFSMFETRIYKKTGKNFYFFKVKFRKNLQNTVSFIFISKKIFINIANFIGLSNNDILSLTNYLQWKINFTKLNKHDKFSIVTNNIFIKNKKNKKNLLAVRVNSRGKDYYIFRAKNGKFYDQNGLGLSINFMRYPTKKKYRISSNFNLHRLNPVTGYVIPHKGIDFAIPTGTPVLGVGDGKVIITKKSIAAGNYVTIRHVNNYITKYMHLKKILVKPGQNIKMGDEIGLSGNTGRSTGPHLHYEIWINNKAVNPLITRLPMSDKLTGKNLDVFLKEVQQFNFN